jgi:hypothetical protein
MHELKHFQNFKIFTGLEFLLEDIICLIHFLGLKCGKAISSQLPLKIACPIYEKEQKHSSVVGTFDTLWIRKEKVH